MAALMAALVAAGNHGSGMPVAVPGTTLAVSETVVLMTLPFYPYEHTQQK